MIDYLQETDIVDFSNKEVHTLAMDLADGCKSDEQIAKKCFEYVRDNIKHSGDYKANITTRTVS